MEYLYNKNEVARRLSKQGFSTPIYIHLFTLVCVYFAKNLSVQGACQLKDTRCEERFVNA